MVRKTWIIPTSPGEPARSGAGHPRLGGLGEANDRPAPDPYRPTEAEAEPPPRSRRPVHPGRTLFWSYFLGPVGLLASGTGRSSPVWVVVAGLSVGAAVLAGRRFGEIAGALRDGQGIGFLLLALLVGALTVGAAAWARGVLVGGREVQRGTRPDQGTVPSPLSALLLGLFLPGLGLHLSRAPERAAAALAGVGALAAGATVLFFAAPLWTWNHHSRFGGVSESSLELVFIAAALFCALGATTWLVQALDGMRVAGIRARREPGGRGDGFGFALLAAIVVLAASFRPALWAAEFDQQAEWAQAKGLRYVPLGLAETARRLDPSRPDYALRAAALHEALGHRTSAESIQSSLGSSWFLYRAGMRERTAQATPVSAPDSSALRPPIEFTGPMPREPEPGCPRPTS